MFTGIIEAIGSVRRLQPIGGDLRFVIDTGALDMSDMAIGDSIAVNGVCLTAIEHDACSFTADVSNETISLTTLKNLKAGSPVNLEKPCSRPHVWAGTLSVVMLMASVQYWTKPKTRARSVCASKCRRN